MPESASIYSAEWLNSSKGQIEVIRLTIPKNSYVAGRGVAEIALSPRFPAGSLIVGYQTHPHDDLIIPNGNTILESGSTVLIVTKIGLVRQVINFIKG